jgi:hydrogenase maturation protease
MVDRRTSNSVRVICLGNELVRDDGVGIRVGRVLKRLDLPSHVIVELRGVAGLELLDELRPDEELILVDAGQTGQAPGTCTVLEMSEAAGLSQAPYCVHGMGLAEVLRIASELYPERLPPRAAIVVIEGEDFESYDLSLTEAVKAALPDAVEIVLRTIGTEEPLQRKGRIEGEKWKEWAPSIRELVEE